MFDWSDHAQESTLKSSLMPQSMSKASRLYCAGPLPRIHSCPLPERLSPSIEASPSSQPTFSGTTLTHSVPCTSSAPQQDMPRVLARARPLLAACLAAMCAPSSVASLTHSLELLCVLLRGTFEVYHDVGNAALAALEGGGAGIHAT